MLNPGKKNIQDQFLDKKNLSIVQILGPRVRSGTNFLSNILNIHPEISVFPKDNTRLETPWIQSITLFNDAWNDFDIKFSQRSFFKLPKKLSFNEFAEFLSDGFIKYLLSSYKIDSNSEYLLLKDPSFKNLSFFFRAFPNGKLVLIIRDGRDNISSSMKAYIRNSNRKIDLKRVKKYINRYTYREFYLSTLYWKRSIRELQEFKSSQLYKDNNGSVLIVKYEDLVQNPSDEASKLFKFLGLNYSENIMEKIKNLSVVGSSYYGPNKNENALKPNWSSPVEKTSSFKPIGRWKNWSLFQKFLFKKIAGRELIELDYEKNNEW